MQIVEIKQLDNGAHRNQSSSSIKTVPDGWALIPDDMECENFPFGNLEAEEIDGVMTVTKWAPLPIPEPEPEEYEPTADDILTALLTGEDVTNE